MAVDEDQRIKTVVLAEDCPTPTVIDLPIPRTKETYYGTDSLDRSTQTTIPPRSDTIPVTSSFLDHLKTQLLDHAVVFGRRLAFRG